MRLPGPLTEDQAHQLGIIRSSGQQLLALLNDVIDLAKMESGRAAPRKEAFSCGALMEDVATRLRHHAERKHLQLTVQRVEELELVSDRRAVQQILHQLLDNAIKFSQQGAVSMEMRPLEREGRGWIEIRITDTGSGLCSVDVDRLRAAFVDLDGPIRVGSGLGLHIARKFAQLVGGHLELDSESGGGSRFSLLLPRE
jgi:protein-histidine pros-kinase